MKYDKYLQVHARRDSVCMGDDVNAPHDEEIAYDPETLLSEFLDEVADYLPSLSNVVWTVRCCKQDIGKLIFDEKCDFTKILSCDNRRFADLGIKEIYCKHESFEPGEIEIPEAKRPCDMISDGILAYGDDVGRFVFCKDKVTVYALMDLQHLGPSDVMMVYQISKADYDHLLTLSEKDRIPDKPVPERVTDACKKRFLCGDSAYCYRNQCTLVDVDMNMADGNIEYKPPVMNSLKELK